jgi:hypothetical protein
MLNPDWDATSFNLETDSAYILSQYGHNFIFRVYLYTKTCHDKLKTLLEVSQGKNHVITPNSQSRANGHTFFYHLQVGLAMRLE